MHTHTRDNIGDHDRTSAYLRNRSYHLWAGRPIPPVCWLRGHRPELRIVSPRSADVLWGVHCGRCGAVPTLSEHVVFKLAEGWEPTPEWLDDLDARNGWQYHERIEAGAQVVVPARPRKAFSLRFHLGGLGSETPIDVHAEFAGLAVYANTSVGRRLAHRITGGQGRDVSLSAHSFGDLAGAWSVSWYLWVDRWGDMTGISRAELPRWRRGSVSIPTPADLLLGTRKLTRTVVDEVQTIVTIDGDDDSLTHMITMKLERCVIGRERMPAHTHERYWNVDWDVVRGFDPIGTRQEGGRWVRGRVYGTGVRIEHHDATAPDRAWIAAAAEAINAWARRARAREAGVRG